jgi:hypothetical protein
MTTQSTSLRFADLLSAEPYAWPGGYPRYAITSDGAAICPKCAATERELIATTTGSDGWCVVGLDINWENDSLHCDHCSDQIPSAYGDD